MSQETIEKKLEYLDETKQLIGQALVTKGQTLDSETPFRDYVQKVLDIQTGYDTRDATAVASEVLKGKTFYNSQGKVEGTLVPKTGDIKKFETIEEMQADANAQEGDLAVVYRSEIQNATVDNQFSTATFPSIVVLPQAITDYVDVRYRAVDDSIMFDCWGMLDANMFDMNCYTEIGEIRIQYESSDGITYTRTDGGDEVVDFGTEIYYAYPDYWNDDIGYFIQAGGNTFDGLYQCKNVVDTSTYKFHALTDITFEGATPVFKEGSLLYDAEVIHNAINAVMLVDDTIKKATPATFIFMDEDTIAVLSSTGRGINAIYYSEELEYLGAGPDGHSTMASQPYRLVNLKTLEVSDSYTVAASDGIFSNFTPLSVWIHFNFSNNQITEITKNYNNVVYVGNTINYCPVKFEVYILKYLLASTQLTLGSSNELLPGKTAYGKTGVVEGDDSIYSNLDKAKILNLIYKYPKSFESENYKIYSPYKNNLYISNTLDAFPKYYKKDENGTNYIAKAKNLTTYKDFIHLLEIEKDQIRLITYDSLSSRWVIALKTGLYIINKDKTEIEKSYSCTIYEAHRYIAVLNGYVIFNSTINDIIGTYALDLTTLELNTLISGGMTSTEFALNNIDNTNIIVSTYTRDESPSTSYHIGRLSLFDINVENRTITKLVNEVSCYTSYFSNYYIYPAVPNFDNHFYILLSYRQSSSSKDYKYIAFKFDKETQTYTTLYDQTVSFLDCNLGSYGSYSFRRNPIDPIWYFEDENYIYDIMLRKKFPISSSIVNASSGVSISISYTNINNVIQQASNDVLFDSQGNVYRATPGLSEINYDADDNKLEITNLSIPYNKLGSYNIFQVDDDLVLSLGSAYGNLYNLVGNKLYLQNTTYYAEFELTRIQEIDIAEEQFDYILVNTCISYDDSYIAPLVINNNHNVSDISDEEYQTALDTAYSIRDDATE